MITNTHSTQTKELRYLVLAQIIGCLLVILGHSFPFVAYVPESVLDIRSFIYTFHLPLFVYCSGFLFAYTHQTDRKSFQQFVSERAKKLLLPYFLLSLIGILPKHLCSSVLNDSLNMDLVSLIRVFFVPRENIWGHFWFLPMIFFLGILAFATDKCRFKYIDKRGLWSLVCIILAILSLIMKANEALQWLGINDIIHFGWCYSFGIISFHFFGDISQQSLLKNRSIWVYIMIGAGIVISIIIHRQAYDTITPIKRISDMVIALLMTTSIIMVCALYNNQIAITKKQLIAQTYQIFILSWPCQLVVEVLMERVFHFAWYLIMPCLFTIGIVGPLLIIKMIELLERKSHTHFLSLVIGK